MADLGDNLDKLEEAKDALANKKISVLGFSFSWTQLVVAAGVVSSAVGALYAGFLMYQKVESVANLDVGAFEQRMELIEQKVTSVDENIYAVKNDLKTDIRRIEGISDDVERNSKEMNRDLNTELRAFRQEMKDLEDRIRKQIRDALTNSLAEQ
jgi:triphosphoribosyl-dephospho-CoA synthetase